MQMLGCIGLLYFVTKRRLLISIVERVGVERVPEEIKEFVRNKNIITNIFWVQANNSVTCGYFCIGFIDFVLTGKKLTDFTSIFYPHDFKRNDQIVLSYFRDEWNWKNKLDWSDKIQINEISKIENYFHEEINQIKSCSKKLSKYVTAFDSIDTFLIVLSATIGGVSICSFTSVVGVPVGIASASFTLVFSVTAGIVKKSLSITRKKRKSMIKLLC